MDKQINQNRIEYNLIPIMSHHIVAYESHINYDKYHDESKTRTHRLSKLPDNGDPLAPNNLLSPEQKKKHQLIPGGPRTDKKLRPQPTKMNSSMSGLS